MRGCGRGPPPMTLGEMHRRLSHRDRLRESSVVVWNREHLRVNCNRSRTQINGEVMPDFGSWATAWWKPILFVIIAGHLTNVSVTLFLHRAQTHRGVKLHYLAALPMRIWLWLSAGIVNGVGHAVGYRNFNVKDESRNISPIAIWLGGEELHNNHHADPHSAKFKAKWYELDIGWVYLRLLSIFGLAEISYARR